jgi:hypothetical protein
MSAKKSAIEAAYDLGKEFAEYLNQTPYEAQNWSFLERNDELPNYAYIALRNKYEMTREIENAYKDGFNETFIPIGYEEEDEEEEEEEEEE